MRTCKESLTGRDTRRFPVTKKGNRVEDTTGVRSSPQLQYIGKSQKKTKKKIPLKSLTIFPCCLNPYVQL